MAIKRPDIYEHNNPNLPIADSDFVRGGSRSAVQTLNDLYALTAKAGQLKQHSTQIYVSGENKIYLLKDVNNIGNSNGWEEFNFGGGTNGGVNVVYTSGNQTVEGQKTFESPATVFGAGNIGKIIISDDSFGGELGIMTSNDEVLAIKYQDGSFRYGGGSPGNEEPLIILDGIASFTNRPKVNGTGVLLSGEAVRSNGTVNSMIKLTQAQYNALSPVDSTTFYVIVG